MVKTLYSILHRSLDLTNTNAINDKDILVSHALLSIYILNKFGVSYEDFVEMLKKVKAVLKG